MSPPDDAHTVQFFQVFHGFRGDLATGWNHG